MNPTELTLPRRDEVTIYRNEAGTITIKADDWAEQRSQIVTITAADVPAVCRVLRAIAKSFRDDPEHEPNGDTTP